MEITEAQQKAMNAMLAEQEARKKSSLVKAKATVVKEESFPIEAGATRVKRTVDPADLRPNPFRTTTEDVVANSDDEEGKFEKRKDEGIGRS